MIYDDIWCTCKKNIINILLTVAYGTLVAAHNLNHGHFRWFWRDLGCANPAPSQLGQSQPVPERRSTHKDTLGIPIVCRHETGCPDSSSHSYSQLGQAGHPDDQNGVKGFLWELWRWLKQKHAKKFLELNILNFIHKAVRFDANISFCSLHRYPTGKGIHRIRMVFHLLKPVLNCAYHEPHDVPNWSKLRKIEGSAWYHFPVFYWSTVGYHLATTQSRNYICDQNSPETW